VSPRLDVPQGRRHVGLSGDEVAALREVPPRARPDDPVVSDEEEVPVPAGELGHERGPSARSGEAEGDHPVAGDRLHGEEARPLEVAPERLLERRRAPLAARARRRGVETRDVRLPRDEQACGPARPEELEGERPLAVDAHRVHPRAREGRELCDDGVDLAGGEGHGVRRGALPRKCSGRPKAAAALDS
jgi:hypothetical protein